MSKYLDGMRELDITSGEPQHMCWFLLNHGTRACIKERGHDEGVHEGVSEKACAKKEEHEAHSWTEKHYCQRMPI